MPRPLVRTALAAGLLVAVAAIAGCSGPGGAGGPGGGGQQPAAIDPWIGDDLEVDAAVLTGNFMGVDLVGLSCDVSQYFFAEGAPDVLPTASVIVTAGGSSIGYDEETLTSVAQGSDLPPSGGMPATFSVTTTQGFWDIGEGGENTAWTPSAELAFTAVPIPEDGCTAADMWFSDMREVGTDAAEVVRAFSEDGLKNVEAECPDAGFTWTPPNMTCDEYEARSE